MITQLESPGGEDDDRGSVFKPSQLLSAGDGAVAGDLIGSLPSQVQEDIREMQSDGRNQNGRYGHQGNWLAVFQSEPDSGPLVLAEKLFDAFERYRIDVPGIAADVGDVLDLGRRRRMKTVIHRRIQAKCHVGSVVKGRGCLVAAEKLGQRVGKSFRLNQLRAFYGATGAHNAVARTSHHVRFRIDRASPRSQLSGKTGVKALEAGFFCLTQVQIGKKAPRPDRALSERGAFDLAEFSHQARQKDSWNPIGEQKIKVFLEQQSISHRLKPGSRLLPCVSLVSRNIVIAHD